MVVIRRTVPRSSSLRQFVFALAAAAVAAALIGVAVAPSLWATRRVEVNDQLDMPPFEMTRTVTDAQGIVSTFDFRFEGQHAWKETLIASTAPVPGFAAADPAGFLDIGSYQELRDGKLTHSHHGVVWQEQECEGGAGCIRVPGPWLADLDFLRGRYKDAVVTTEGSVVTVRVASPLEVSEWVFDAKTGIPLAYRTIVDGKTTFESRATSVRLLSGEVIR